MRTSRLLGSSLAAMTRWRLRTAFLILGSLVGVAALTLVVSIGQGAERRVLGTVKQLFGETAIIVQAGGASLMGPRGEAARLTLDDLAAVAREVPEIEVWDAQQEPPRVPARRAGAEPGAGGTSTPRVLGQSERWPRVWSRGVTRGESFDAAAVASSARVAVIGETVARRLFGDEDPIGADIQVGSVSLRVIGVLEPFGTDLHGMDRDDEVIVPLTTATRRMMNVDTILAGKLLVRDAGQVESVALEVKRILRERHGLAAGQRSDFSLITAVQVRKMVGTVQRVLFVFLPLVAGVSLLAGGAASAAVMLASVSARIAEIGLRRAVGARPADIRLQFLMETAVTALTGGVLGIGIGYALARMAARRLGLDGAWSWTAVLVGIAVSLATGLLAGVLPARRAAALDPATALR